MRCFYLAVALVFGSVSSYGQSGSGWLWEATSGIATNSSGKNIRDVRTDAAGNTYAVGDFWGSMTLGNTTLATLGDGTVNYNYDRDAFVVKYDHAGNVLWAQQFGTAAVASNQNGSVIAVDGNGNVYIGGSGYGGGSTAGVGFVVKYSSAGTLLWSKTYTYYDIGGINIGPDGNPVVMETDQTHKNIFKLDAATGNTIWQFNILNAGSNSGTTYHDFVDNNGNSYFTFFTSGAGSVNINSTAYPTTGLASFIVSLNSAGGQRWVAQLNNAQIQLGMNLDKSTGDSYLQVSGGGGSTFQGVPVGASYGNNTYFVLNSAGTLSSYAAVSPYKSGLMVITPTAVYAFHKLGGTNGGGATEVFGNNFIANRTTLGQDLGVIVKYDKATATPLWLNSFEMDGSGVTALNSMDVGADGECVVGGSFGTSAKFGSTTFTPIPGTLTVGFRTDWYVARFNSGNVSGQPSTTWTGAAGNSLWTDAANWSNGLPTGSLISILPAGLSTYPTGITTANVTGRLQIAAGVTVTLPLDFKAPAGVINDGAIQINQAGTFYGGFNSGSTPISGSGKVVITNSAVQPFWYVPLDNSLEINCSGTITSLSNGAPINGSLIFTNGILNSAFGNIVLGNPSATVSFTPTSYMTGTLQRAVNTSGSYTFPVGTATNPQAVTLTLKNIVGPQSISVAFSATAPGTVNTTAAGVGVTAALNSGFWTITPSAALTSGSYNVSLSEKGATNTVADPSRYVVIKRPNSSGAWAFLGNNGQASQASGTVTSVVGNLSSFSDFAIGIAASTVNVILPVRWVNFSAAKKSDGTLLQWETANETNVAAYEVEYSEEGIEWKTAGRVVAKNTEAAMYDYHHLSGFSGLRYYRIKEVDRDGKTSYSIIKKLEGDQLSLITLYPNPVSGHQLTIAVQTEGIATLHYVVMNAAGQLVQEGVLQNKTTTIDVEQLARGIYTIRLDGGATAVFSKP